MMELKTNAKERTFTQKAKDALKFHLIDSTALLVASYPIYAAFETRIAGINNASSIHSKVIVGALTYGGMGFLYGKVRDVSRRLFGIKPETSEAMKYAHDVAYSAGFNLVTNPLFYYAAGVRDIKQIAIATGLSIGVSLAMGGAFGYSIDALRDLTGLKESERLPKSIDALHSRAKKTVAALAVAGSFALTTGVYLTNHSANNNRPVTQHAIESR